MAPGPDFLKFWAKADKSQKAPYHPLPYHGLDVAAVGGAYLSRNPRSLSRLKDALGLPQDESLRLIQFLLAMHDLGKFSNSFQSQVPDLHQRLHPDLKPIGTKYRHDTIGFILWCAHVVPRLTARLFPLDDDARNRRKASRALVGIGAPFLGHHGEPPKGEGRPVINPAEYPPSTLAAIDSFVDEAYNLIIGDDSRLRARIVTIDREQRAQISWELAGLAVLCDWIGSNTKWFPYKAAEQPLSDYWSSVQNDAESACKESGVLPVELAQGRTPNDLFPNLTDLRPMQAAAWNLKLDPEGGMYIIEDATGSGKTEAACILSYRIMAEGCADGFYVGLPTMASANAMYTRMAESYRNLFNNDVNPSLSLAHSRSQNPGFQEVALANQTGGKDYSTNDSSVARECSHWIGDSRKRALLSHIGVGSIDQALLASLPVRHQSLRLLGLQDKVLIVDEVHAYDPYMLTILESLLRFIGNHQGSVILLSATLPQKTKTTLISAFRNTHAHESEPDDATSYPLLTHVTRADHQEHPVESASRRELPVDFVDSEAQLWRHLQEGADSGCACWIRNTVTDAVATYHQAKEKLDAEVVLFHSRFTGHDRAQIEKKVLERVGEKSDPSSRRGLVVIATQVIEQSLDLDFDAMVSDLAPIDLLIQRSGRLHRHHTRTRKSAPRLVVFSPQWKEDPGEDWFKQKFPRGAYVYPDHAGLWLTQKTLQNAGAIVIPRNIRGLVEAVYGETAMEQVPPGLEQSHVRAWGDHYAKKGRGESVILSLAAGYDGNNHHWSNDDHIPTRIGDPTHMARLGVLDDNEVVPIHGSKSGWVTCELNIPYRRLSPEARSLTATPDMVEKACRTMKDSGKWSLLIPMEMTGSSYQALMEDPEKGRITINYDPETGINIEGGGK